MTREWNNEEKFIELQSIDDPDLIHEIHEEIFHKNKGLAVHYATKFYKKGHSYEMDDLTQVALMALWECIDRYKVNHGAKFSTYASFFIKGRIKNFFRDKTWNIYAPKKDKEILQKYNTACNSLIKNGIEVTEENLYKYTNLTEEEYIIGENLSGKKYTVDLDGFRGETYGGIPNNSYGMGLTNSELIPSTDITMEEDAITKILLNDFLKKLDKDEELVFVEKYIKGRNNNYISHNSNMSYSKIKRIDKDLIEKFMEELDSESTTHD